MLKYYEDARVHFVKWISYEEVKKVVQNIYITYY